MMQSQLFVGNVVYFETEGDGIKKLFDHARACCAVGSVKTLMAARLLNEKGLMKCRTEEIF